MGRHSLFAAGLALATLAPLSASAQQTTNEDARARVHFQSAAQYYDDGRYEEAIPEFREAYRLSHRPEMLLNLANAAEHALRPGDAADAIDEYLRAVPNATDRPALERRLTRDREGAARMAAGQHVDAPPPDAGNGGHGGPTTPITPPPTTSGGGMSGLAVAGIVTLGVGVATGVVSLILGLVANDQFAKLEMDCPMHVCTTDHSGDASGGKSLAIVSTVLTFVGAAAGIAGVVLLVMGLGEHHEAAPTAPAAGTVALVPGPGDVGLAARVAL